MGQLGPHHVVVSEGILLLLRQLHDELVVLVQVGHPDCRTEVLEDL